VGMLTLCHVCRTGLHNRWTTIKSSSL